MKKWLSCLMVCLLTLSQSLTAQTIVLNESFENGIPSAWTQQNMSVAQDWKVESGLGLTYPEGAYSGEGRAYLRNTSGQTMGYKTRLITPAMDIQDVYIPIVRFAHAQAKWTADFDTLRVYYRTAENGDWVMLREYSSAINDWKWEEIQLPAPSKTYRLAFEGSDNMGRGIVLDSVVVRSTPECTVPHDLYATNKTDTSLVLGWLASFDADSFHIIVSEGKEVNIEEEGPDAKYFQNFKIEAGKMTCQITGLKEGQTYYFYVRSLCEAEKSNWSTALKVYVTPTEEIPYYCDFNMPYEAGTIHHMDGWHVGNNLGIFPPFVPTHLQNKTDLAPYSADSTRVLAFTGANNMSTVIPEDGLMYAVSPMLTGAKISDIQVRFKATANRWGNRAYAHSLIVGVIVDPEDMTTFTAIDTIEVKQSNVYEEFVVSMASYTGEGRYVALVSNFDKENIIFVDDFYAELRSDYTPVTAIDVLPDSVSAWLTWNGSASKYNVLVSDVKTVYPGELAEKNVLCKATVNAKTYQATGLKASQRVKNQTPNFYYAYVQSVVGDSAGAWSLPQEFYTSTHDTLPIFFGFEMAEGTWYRAGLATYIMASGTYANSSAFSPTSASTAYYPYVQSSCCYKGARSFKAQGAKGSDNWLVFPMVDDVKQVQMIFYLCASSKAYADRCQVQVGVMTNPTDKTTFTPIQSFAAGADYLRCYANFTTYTGKGQYIAMFFNEPEGADEEIAYVDNVTIEKLGNCIPVTIEADEIKGQEVTLSWGKALTDRYDVRVTEKYYDVAVMDTLSEDACTFVQDSLTSNKLKVTGLRLGTEYYAYVRTYCDGEATIWSSAFHFATTCDGAMTLPYVETFDGLGGTTTNKMIPACWQTIFGHTATGTTYYPYMTSTYNYPAKATGAQCLYMPTYVNATTPTSSYDSYIAMPKLDAQLKDVILKFYIYYTSLTYKSEVYVGVMTDPLDYGTFVTYDTVSLKEVSTWQECNVNFEHYTGSDGYIAFSTHRSSTNYIYLDQVSVQNIQCITPFDIQTTEVDASSMTFTWGGKSDNGWKVYFCNKEINPDTISDSDPAVISTRDVTTASYSENGLTANTPYYIYVRANCESLQDTAWGTAVLRTECSKLNPRSGYTETFDQYTGGTSGSAKATRPDCWTVGNAGASSSSQTTYLPFIYSSTTYAHSGKNCLRLYGYYSATATSNASPAWACSPEIDVEDLSSVTADFWVYVGSANSANYSVLIGAMTDPDDFSTFTLVDSLTFSKTGKQECTVEFDKYKGDGKYIAFRTRLGGSGYLYLDDFTVMLNSCPAPRPAVSKVTDTSARVASNLRVDNPWRLLLLSEEVSTDSLQQESYVVSDSIIVLDTIVSKSRQFQLTELTSSTDYYVYATTICEGIVGKWVGVSFSTLCPPTEIEQLAKINFDKCASGTSYKQEYVPDCWRMGNKSTETQTSYLPYIYKSSSYASSGLNCLRLYSTTTYNGAYAIMPQMDVDTVTDLQVRFEVNCGSTTYESNTYAHSVIVGIITDPYDLSTFTPVDTISFNAEHTVYTVRFNEYTGDYQGDYGKTIAFMSEFSKTNYAYIDDIQVMKIPACPDPLKIQAAETMDSSAVIVWKGMSAQYRVILTDSVVANPDSIFADAVIGLKDSTRNFKILQDFKVNEEKASIKNLNANTTYYVYVQGICDAQKSPWNYAPFTTECPLAVSLPYTEDFESFKTGSGNHPTCWITDYTYASSDAYPYVYAGQGVDGSKCLYFYSTKSYKNIAILPPFNVTSWNDMYFTCYSKLYSISTTYGSDLAVGLVTDVDNPYETFTKVAMISPTEKGVYQRFAIDFTQYDLSKIPATARLAILADATMTTSSYIYGYIDNIRLEPRPDCFMPEAVVVDQAGRDYVDLSITPHDSVADTKWEVRLLPTSIAEPKETDGLFFTVDTLNPHLTGLANSTIYKPMVRTICDQSSKSAWAEGSSFNTEYYIDSTYYVGFEDAEGWQLIPGATTTTYKLHPSLTSGNFHSTSTTYLPYQTTTSTSYLYGNNSDNALRFYATATYPGPYIILPKMNPTKELQLQFDMRSYYSNRSTQLMTSSYPDATLAIAAIPASLNTDSIEILGEFAVSQVASGDSVLATNNYLFDCATMPLPEMGDKRLMIYFPDLGATAYMYMDNLTILPKTGVQTPALPQVDSVSDNAITVQLPEDGERYNVYVIDNISYNPRYASASMMKSFTNQEGKATISGLESNTTYYVYIEPTLFAGQKGALSPFVSVKTTCPARSADVYYTFEEGEEVEAEYPKSATESDAYYTIPVCWGWGSTVKTSTKYYNPYIIKNGYTFTGSTTSESYAKYKYAKDGSQCLKLFSYSATQAPYIALPKLILNADTAQIEFDASCVYENTSSTATASTTLTTYIGTSYDQTLIIGSMTNPSDPSTFVGLDTVTYPYTSSDITTTTALSEDPAGMRYFKHFAVPLFGVTGDYIALLKPGKGLFLIDNLKIGPRTGCIDIKSLHASNITSSSATLSWKTYQESQYALEVSTVRDFSTLTIEETLMEPQFELSGLSEKTTYYWRVKMPECGEDPTLEWPWHTDSLTTPCNPVGPSYTCSFEAENDGWVRTPGSTTDTYKIDPCWTVGNGYATATYSYKPYEITSTTYQYARTGSYALKLYAYSTYTPAYAIMPALSYCDMDTLQVSFYGRCGYLNASSQVSTSYTTSTYSRTIVVGTVTDPKDFSTFTPIDTLRYSQELTSGDQGTAANNYFWEKFSVSLKNAKGKYVTFVAPKIEGYTYGYFFIDDVFFEPLNECRTPKDLTVEDITKNNATLSWSGQAEVKFRVVLADNSNLSEPLYDTIVSTSSFNVTTLKPSTTYYWRVKQLCNSSDESDWTAINDFTTVLAPLYYQQFDNGLGDWEKDSLRACYAFNNGMQPKKYTTGWTHVSTGYGINTKHPKVNIYGTTCKYWLISPLISLDNVQPANLRFQLALTDYGNGNSITTDAKGETGVDDQFMVIISDDGGETWKRENATIWNNETVPASDSTAIYGKGDYVYNKISATGEYVRIDLSKYKGKNIKIAFYGESRVSNADNDLHIGRVHVNYFSEQASSTTACQFNDINVGDYIPRFAGQVIDGDKVEAGEQVYEYASYTNQEGLLDSIYRFTANIMPAPITTIEADICEGETYEQYGFTPKTKTGVYRQKHVGVNTCDSIVELRLTVKKHIRVNIVDTICRGQKYYYFGRVFDRAGVYSDTTSSLVSGCDSITTLVLVTVDGHTTRRYIEDEFCQGSAYSFGGKMLTVPGIYADTSRLEGCDCDSITTLHLSMKSTQYQTICDTITEGSTYPFGTQLLTTTGAYTDTFVSTLTGCDSVVTLYLTVGEGVKNSQRAQICQGETYTFKSKEFTKSCIYRDTTYSEPGHVMQVDELVLLVVAPVTVNIVETICEGSSYQFGDTVLTTTGSYVRTLSSLVTGCDSTVILELYVMPAEVNAFAQSICEGEYYEFGGKKLTQTGVYTDSTYTEQEHCLVIDQLTLTVNKIQSTLLNDSICEGGTYEFHKRIITKPGTYVDTLISAGGCDSIVTLVLSIADAYHSTENVTICEGERYFFEGRYYTKTIKVDTTFISRIGCDSIRTLNLTVNEPEKTFTYDTIYEVQLPYTYKSLVYDARTPCGTYVDTIKTPGEGCGEWEIHTLTILAGTDVLHVGVQDLRIVPTIIHTGETVMLMADGVSGAAEYQVDVFNMVGQRIVSTTTEQLPYTLDAFSVSGVYTVRVKAADQLFIGRVMVR